MRKRALIAAGVAAAVAVTMAGCGSSSNSSDGGGGSTKAAAAGSDINLGVVTPLTGGYSSGFITVEKGVKARLELENSQGGVDGHKLTYKMADDTGTAAGALSATKKLIQQDKVFGILDASPVFYGAAATAKAADIPVTGASFDGGDYWHDKSYTTFFDAYSYGDYSLASSTFGEFFKSQGCTKVGGVGNTGPSSGRAAKQAVISAQNAGLQAGYLETKLAPDSTDTGPAVLGIKSSGTDCLYVPVTPALAFALTASLKQAGVNMKAVVIPTGYGGDILENKAGVQAAQGIDFMSGGLPVEADTDATKAFQSALSKYAGVTGIPTFGEYVGWTVADLFIYGLKQAGGGASQADFVKALRASTTWNADGLYKNPTNFADPAPTVGGFGVGNCTNIVKLTGDKFVPIEGAMPICGDLLDGVKITD